MSELFSDSDSDSPLTVDVPPMVVYVAKAQPSTDQDKAPAYGNWAVEPKLEVVQIFKGSSVAGPSYATLKVATGAPLTTDDDNVEDAVDVGQGDRIAIAMGEDPPRFLFAGYVTQAHLSIGADAEGLLIKAMGPEWVWGAHAGGGARRCVVGQVRRTADSDDEWAQTPDGTTTVRDGLECFTDERAIFNPGGRKNMAKHDVYLTKPASDPTGSNQPPPPPPVQGRAWEQPDRRLDKVDVSEAWTRQQAIKTLCCWYNDPAVTGIDNPPDWSAIPVPDDLALRQIDVDGMGLWEALCAVCGPEYGFFVSPKIDGADGTTWSGFQLTFFDRAKDIDGTGANLVVNPLRTPAASCAASVVRLQAAKDATHTVNQVRVFGKAVRHVRLYYHGDKTPSLSDEQKKLALQHGWVKNDGNLRDFAGTDGGVTTASIEGQGPTAEQTWREQWTTKGPKFPANAKTFRLFVWNESGEFRSNSGSAKDWPVYGSLDGSGRETDQPLNWFVPSLTGIADLTGLVTGDQDDHAGVYCRRRRRLLDTEYFDAEVDAWRRVRPTLWVAHTLQDGTDDPGQLKWVRLHSGDYRVDPERGAVWMTHENLAEWRPFARGAQDGDDPEADDDRTFATLLYGGQLRMLLECSVETDWALEARSARQASAAYPLVREATFRGERDYAKSAAYDDGITSPSGGTGQTVDTSAEAQEFADRARDAGEDQQTHASVLVSADWPEQGIGKMITTTAGRVIDLSSGAGGKGAQVVAVHMDAQTMKWELLTETAALQLRAVDRARLARPRNTFLPRGGPAVSGAQAATARAANLEALRFGAALGGTPSMF